MFHLDFPTEQVSVPVVYLIDGYENNSHQNDENGHNH